MRTAAVVVCVLPVVLLVSDPVAGQQPFRVELSAHGGLYAPLGAVGPAAPADGPRFLRLKRARSTPTLGVTAETRWPLRRLGFRVTGLYLFPSEASGRFDCAPGLVCPAVLLPTAADVDLLVVRGDLVLSPFGREGRLRPYALFGGGVKRYTFSWSETGELIAEGRHRETALALHAGLGIALDLLGNSFRVEVSDYWSGAGDPVAPGFEEGGLPAPRRRSQHDLGLSLGWRLLRL